MRWLRARSLNDRYGHAAGDAALQGVGTIILATIRKCDIAVRWGGEELLLILPHTGEAGARALAERIRVKVAKLETGRGVTVTVSAGVSELAAGESVLAAVARADARLYEAKALGRDRVA